MKKNNTHNVNVEDLPNSTDNTNTENLPKHNKVLGIVFILVNTVSIATLGIIAKYLFNTNPEMGAQDYLLIRTVFMALFSIIQGWWYDVNVFKIPKEMRVIVIVRSSILALVLYIYNSWYKYLSALIVSQVFYLHPIFIIFMAYFWLGEKLSIMLIGGSFVAYLGTGLIAYANYDPNMYVGDNMSFIWTFLLVIWTSVVALTSTLLKYINKTLHFIVSPISLTYVLLLINIILLVVRPSLFMFSLLKDPYFILWCFICAILWTSYHTTLSMAFNYEKASVLAPYQFTEAIMVLIGEIILLHTWYAPLEWIGVGLIFISTFFLMMKQNSEEFEVKHVQQIDEEI